VVNHEGHRGLEGKKVDKSHA